MTYEELEALLKQADELNKTGDFEEAEKRAKQVLAALEKADSPKEKLMESERAVIRCKALITSSESKGRRGDYQEAISLALKSIDITEEQNLPELKVKAQNILGLVYNFLSDYTKALEYFKKAQTINEEIGSKKGVATNLGNIGIVYDSLSDYAKALEYYQKALAINEEIGAKNNFATVLGNIGSVYNSLSDYPKALEYQKKALAIYEEIGSKEGITRNLGNIGNVYSALSDHNKALEYHQKSLATNKEIGNKLGITINLSNIGSVYNSLSDYPKALEYQKKALAIYEDIGSKKGISISLGNIGETHKSLKDYKSAEEYLLKALQLSEEIGAEFPRLHWLLILGELYQEQQHLTQDPTEAETFLKLAIADSTKLGVKHITRDASYSCYLLYKEQERWEEALEMKELFEKIKDEINVEEVKKQEAIREQQKEIEIAKATAEARMNATTALLHKVLPESISTRMLEGEENISDYFPSISILFADIKGFTAISTNMKAIDVVRFLNFIFAEFDRIMKTHGCEKIKTIGDGYMAVAGAPEACDDHAERLAAAALEMQETINIPDDIRRQLPKGARFGIRIGLHTGAAVAGVIGKERFVYDIHSDAVNLASRMETNGEADRVHVSADFAAHLQNRFKITGNTKHKIKLVDRGEMEVKGKGKMKTYFLEKEV